MDQGLKQEIEEQIGSETIDIDQLLQKLLQAVEHIDFSEHDLLEYSQRCHARRLKLFDSERAWGLDGLLMRCLEVDGREDVAIQLLRHEHAMEKAKNELKPFVLHVAVARRRNRFLLEFLGHLTEKEQNEFVNLPGSEFPKNTELKSFEGCTPVCIAALNKDLAMIRTLLRKGANLDAKGNNAIHSVISNWKIISPQKQEDSDQDQQELARVVQELLQVQKNREGTSSVEKLLFHKNAEGLTPLLLATKCGAYEVVRLITSYPGVYKLTATSGALADKFAYDVTEIYSVDGGVSVLRLLQDYSDEEPVRATDIVGYSPISDMIKLKFQRYSTIHIVWMLLHILIMGCFTLAVNERNRFEELDLTGNRTNSSLTNVTNVTREELKSFLDSYYGDYRIARVVFEVILLAYAASLAVVEVCALCGWSLSRRRPQITLSKALHMLQHFFTVNFLFDKSDRIWFMFFSISTIIALIVRITNYHYDDHTVCMVLASGWWCTLHFFRGLGKRLSVLTAMIDRIIFRDLLIFFTLYYVVLAGFSFSMNVAFEDSTKIPEGFSGLGATSLTMFKISVGLTEADVLGKARHPGIAKTIFIIFTVYLTFFS